VEIFTLEISFPYDSDDEPWIRVIEVKEDFTLDQLHHYIQEIVAFDNDHLYEFYIGKNTRNKSGAKKFGAFYSTNHLAKGELRARLQWR